MYVLLLSIVMRRGPRQSSVSHGGLGQSLGAEMADESNLCLKGSVAGADNDHQKCLVENHLDKLFWPIPLLSCNYAGPANCGAFQNRVAPVGPILSGLLLGDTGLGTNTRLPCVKGPGTLLLISHK